MTGGSAGDRRRRPDRALGWAWLAVVPPAALWVALTALDGRTYHLAPLVVAAAPGVAARAFGAPTGLVGRRLAIVGILACACAWAVIELLDVVPSATLLHDQPGGVRAEVAVSSASGALVGVLASRRPRRPVNRPRRGAGTGVRDGLEPELRLLRRAAMFFAVCVALFVAAALIGVFH